MKFGGLLHHKILLKFLNQLHITKELKTVKKLQEIGENSIIEIGPGKVLSGLVKRISNRFDILSINQVADIN